VKELMLCPALVYASPVMENVEGVMLAAGSSTRMDTWKLMLPWESTTIIEHSARTVLKVCSRLVLVVGFRGRDLVDVFGDWPRVDVVSNPDYGEGMFSSIQCGVSAVAEGPFFLALGDMPGVSEEVYRDLLEWNSRVRPALLDAGGAYGIIPQFKGKKGHPLLLSAAMRPRILETDPGKTLRDVLAAVPTVIVPENEPGILQDIDTPSDYRSWGRPADPR
jgi:molybdenum cofactor cytidylyltransferase